MRRACLILIFALLTLRASGFAVDAWHRVRTPLEAFHFESTMVHRAWLFEQGLPMHPPWDRPEPPHFHNFYAPCYFAIVGALGRGFGADLDDLFLIGRCVTLASALITSLALGVWLARRLQSRIAGWIGGLASWGALPMFGFAEMVRPDLLAETFGFLGFLLATDPQRRRWTWSLGVWLLALAILTKQPSGLFLIAASCAIGVEQGWRRALGTFASGIGLSVAIAAIWTVSAEPLLPRSLIGETGAPWDFAHWRTVVSRLLARAPSLAIAGVFGILVWRLGPDRRKDWTAFGIVIALGSLATAAKLGSDQNYFLSLRLLEGMAAASLAAIALNPGATSSPRLRTWAKVGLTVWLLSLPIGIMEAWSQAAHSERMDQVLNTPNRLVMKMHQKLRALARDPNTRLLTDSGLLALSQGNQAAFTDPWGFRMLVQTGRLDPQGIQRDIEQERYDVLVLTSMLHDPFYEIYEFGLPEALYRPAREHYELIGREADLFVYAPKSRASR